MEYKKSKKIVLIVASFAVRWVGMAIGSVGIVMVICHCFFSTSNYHWLWLFLYFLQTYVGFKIFEYGYKVMYKEYDNFK